MPRPAQARAWWADVEDVRERIERKRERERQRGSSHRGVREVRPGSHLTLVRAQRATPAPRSRPRRTAIQRIEPHPDRVAAWAVVLGFALVIAAVLSAHG
jgi:hypothetical protein